MVLKFKKTTINKDETKYSTCYLNSKTETINHDTNIDSIFESIYSAIMTKMQKCQGEGSGWTIDSVENKKLTNLKSNLKTKNKQISKW